MNHLSPRTVVHVQLAERLRTLASDGARGVYAVFWLGDLPLGHEYFDPEELPIGPRDLAMVAADCVTLAVAAHLFEGSQPPSPAQPSSPRGTAVSYGAAAAAADALARLRARHESRQATGNLRVTVAVMTRNRPGDLARCLRALQHLTPRPRQVMVVDIGSQHDQTQAVVDSFGDRVDAPGDPGAGWATKVEGDIVAFTDDRCTPHPAWLQALAAAFRDRALGAVSGLVLPAELETEAQVAFERLLGGAHLGFQPATYNHRWLRGRRSALGPQRPRRLGTSANLAVRTDWLHAIHAATGFTALHQLERLARSDLWHRLVASGAHGRYEPAAVVFRHHPTDLKEIEDAAFSWPSDLGAATRSVDHGIQGARDAAAVSSANFVVIAARNILLGTRVERRLVKAGIAGYVSNRVPRRRAVGQRHDKLGTTLPGAAAAPHASSEL
ncbi:MAG: glycosyltransferase family 2 protein [Actinomycetota bacterium]|nr:glycosyltransferase family 2 protein [Actinomycetota bacterium]